MATKTIRRPHNLLHCILRVQHTRSWPAFSSRRQRQLDLPDATGAIEVLVQHYGTESSQAIARSKPLWRIHPDSPIPGYIGNTFVSVQGAGDAFPLENLGTKARVGETDIIASGWSEEDVGWMPDTLRSLAYATAVSLGVHLDDLIVPVTDPYIFVSGVRNKNDRMFEIAIKRAILEPAVAADAAIHIAIEREWHGDGTSTQRGRSFARAARRLMLAASTPDPVDKFLEYWLAAECIASQTSERDVAAGLGRLLAHHLHRTSRRQSEAVQAALRLKTLERVRNDIVHGRCDAVTGADLALLQEIATELVRAELGLKYESNKLIDRALAEYEPSEPKKDRRRRHKHLRAR